VYLLSERDEGAARCFFEDTGELRVWEPEGGRDDEPRSIEVPPDAVETVTRPVLEKPAVTATEPSPSRTRIGPWLRPRSRPGFEGPVADGALQPAFGPFIRTKERGPIESDGEPVASTKIIEAEVVATPSPDPAGSESVPALTRRAHTWILGARRPNSKR
jgi:hypothetical protein